MRYACPSCKRVFYLETKTVSPCPACGTTLTMEGDEEGGAAPAKPAAAAPAGDAGGGGSWLTAGQDAEAPTRITAAPVVTSWLTPPAGGPARPPAPAPSGRAPAKPSPPGAEPMSPAAALDALSAAARPESRGTSAMPTAPRAARAPSARAPTGSHVFLVASVSVFVTAAIAVVAIVLLRKFLPTAPTGPGAAPPGDQRELAALRTKLEETKERLAKEEQRARDAETARRDLEAKFEEGRIQADALKGRLDRLSSALDHALDAQALLERNSDLEEALGLVDAALKSDPGFQMAWRLKGRILAASGVEAQLALDAFEQADKVARDAGEPGDAEALVLAGEVCLTDLGDRKRALGFYERAAGLDAASPYGLAADARASQLQDKDERALAKASELAKADPSLAIGPLVAGEVVLDQAMRAEPGAERSALLEKADLHLAKAVKLEPNSARGCLMRGRVLLEESKLSDGSAFAMPGLARQSRAERLLSAARKLKPRMPDVHLALAELSLASGALRNPAEALQSASEAVRLTARKSAPALALLAQAYAATGDPSKAVTAMKEATTIEPKNKEYLDLLARYKEEAQSLSR